MRRRDAPSATRYPIPPGRREPGERWSASGVEMALEGRSRLSDALVNRVWGAVGAMGMASLLVGVVSLWGRPARPAALDCTVESRWTETCRQVAPEKLAEAVDPAELARRLAANWDFDPDNELWRAGGAPLHVSKQAKGLRSPKASAPIRAAAAASLAGVIQAPASYAGWQPDPEQDAEIVATANELAALYESFAEDAWAEHQAATVDRWEARILAQDSWQDQARWLAPRLFFAWLLTAALAVVVLLVRQRARRPLHLHLDQHELRIEGTAVALSALEALEIRWGRLELTLRDGSSWSSRPLEPRNAGRLELLLQDQLLPIDPARAHDDASARQEVHAALASVLSKARS